MCVSFDVSAGWQAALVVGGVLCVILLAGAALMNWASQRYERSKQRPTILRRISPPPEEEPEDE